MPLQKYSTHMTPHSQLWICVFWQNTSLMLRNEYSNSTAPAGHSHSRSNGASGPVHSSNNKVSIFFSLKFLSCTNWTQTADFFFKSPKLNKQKCPGSKSELSKYISCLPEHWASWKEKLLEIFMQKNVKAFYDDLLLSAACSLSSLKYSQIEPSEHVKFLPRKC